MNVLVLGGTKFLGRHIVDALRARSHGVVLFNRGRTNPDLFADVRTIRGDRENDAFDFAGKRFDAVIDTSGYLPHIVRRSAQALAKIADRYLFISSISVYEGSKTRPDELAPVSLMPGDADATVFAGEHYGALKVLCEREVETAFGSERTTIVRPGIIAGPHDPTGRFSYWPHRIREGGEVLAPAGPAWPVQLIDVRDLARWIVSATEDGRAGTFNATSPDGAYTFGVLFEGCRGVTGSNATAAWADEAFLLESNVAPWADLPLWLPHGEDEWALHVDVRKATAAGLTIRPLVETIRSVLDDPVSGGLTREREREVLERLRGR